MIEAINLFMKNLKDFKKNISKNNQLDKKPSESTIEVKAEEVK